MFGGENTGRRGCAAASRKPEAVIGQGVNSTSSTSRVGEKGEMPRAALFRRPRLDLGMEYSDLE